jgi:signal transduction histidine kinase
MPHGLSVNNRAVVAGFAGLLALMAFAEIAGLRTLQQIESANSRMRDDFVERTQLLDQIRSDVYLSGTYVRDYLLDPESGRAEDHRRSLLETRAAMEAALAKYRQILNAADSVPFEILTGQLAAYWKLLDPVFNWTTAQRRDAGYVFLRDEVFPRRTAMLDLANQIGAIAGAQLARGNVEVTETYNKFRRFSIVVIGLTMGLGIALAAFSVAQIVKLERETAERREQLQQLSARLVEAQEEERRSIARELHDEVGQSLTGVLVEMANLSRLIRSGDTAALPGKADEIKKLVEESISVVRNLALLLRPPMLDDLGLVPALQWQAREISKRSEARVKVAAEQVSDDLPEDVKTSVYRIVQEALHNCVQHSGASNVRVSIRQENGRLLLSVQDDGRGFRAREDRGMGLLGIEERVAHFGGSFAIDSKPGHGTVLRVALPLKESAAV